MEGRQQVGRGQPSWGPGANAPPPRHDARLGCWHIREGSCLQFRLQSIILGSSREPLAKPPARLDNSTRLDSTRHNINSTETVVWQSPALRPSTQTKHKTTRLVPDLGPALVAIFKVYILLAPCSLSPAISPPLVTPFPPVQFAPDASSATGLPPKSEPTTELPHGRAGLRGYLVLVSC